MRGKHHPLFKRLDLLEWRASNHCARLSQYQPILWFFSGISWLGNYPAWIILCLGLIILMGINGWILAISWGLCSAVAGLIYRLVKNICCRERPSISFDVVFCPLPPLDRYSFPSGHTLQAVMFTTLTYQYSPSLFLTVLIFTLLIILSRLILGLHYLSDVIVGALMGYLIALLGIYMIDSIWPTGF